MLFTPSTMMRGEAPCVTDRRGRAIPDVLEGSCALWRRTGVQIRRVELELPPKDLHSRLTGNTKELLGVNVSVMTVSLYWWGPGWSSILDPLPPPPHLHHPECRRSGFNLNANVIISIISHIYYWSTDVVASITHKVEYVGLKAHFGSITVIKV